MSEPATWFIWLGVPFVCTLMLDELRRQARPIRAAISIGVSTGSYALILATDEYGLDAWTPVAVVIGFCFATVAALLAHVIGRFRRL